jgi:hypothetical protein
MVEIAMYNEREAVSVEPLDSGDVRLHIGIDHTADHIEEALQTQGLHHHVEAAVKLMSVDELERDFEPKGDHVLIRPKAKS